MTHFTEPPDYREAGRHLNAIAEVQKLMGPFDYMTLIISWDPEKGWSAASVHLAIGDAPVTKVTHHTFGPDISTDYLICSHAALGAACDSYLYPTLLDAS
jgi:hypothetical protein